MLLKNRAFLFLSTFLFSLVIRIPNIGSESINPDAVNWHYRCQQFSNGIKFFQLEKTYPHYHPGVTLCWVMLLPTELYKNFSGQENYTNQNYLNFNIINTVFLVLIISILLSTLTLQIGGLKGLIFLLLLSLEPFFFGNSKLIHLDTLHSLFLFQSVLLLWNYFYEPDKTIKISKFKITLPKLFLSGFFLALAFLTKSVSLVFLPAMLSFIILREKGNFKVSLKKLSVFLFTFIFSIFILFPALWVDPIGYLTRIFKEADRVGVRTGHSQIFFEKFYGEEDNPGVGFYIFTLLVKFSPLVLFCIIVLLYEFVKSIRNGRFKVLESRGIFFLTVYSFYMFAILYSDKKVDRYLLLLIPVLFYLFSFVFQRYLKFVVGLILLNILSLVYFHPFQFLYYSPILLNFENAEKIIAQKSFGMGVLELRDYVVKNFGEVSIGMYDIKPLEALYPNSKVFDIRESSKSKVDIVILSKNENLPSKYENSFNLKDVFYLKDLPIYKIYIKNEP